jgi:hypothetical protein
MRLFFAADTTLHFTAAAMDVNDLTPSTPIFVHTAAAAVLSVPVGLILFAGCP